VIKPNGKIMIGNLYFQLLFISRREVMSFFFFFFFLCFISIYIALILNRILSTYVLIVSPSTKQWLSHARVSLSCFRRT
jgi:hypothetical protein